MHIETICRVYVQLDAKMCRRVSTEKNKQIRVIQISRYKYNNNKNNNNDKSKACMRDWLSQPLKITLVSVSWGPYIW